MPGGVVGRLCESEGKVLHLEHDELDTWFAEGCAGQTVLTKQSTDADGAVGQATPTMALFSAVRHLFPFPTVVVESAPMLETQSGDMTAAASMPRFQPGETPSPGIVSTEVSLAGAEVAKYVVRNTFVELIVEDANLVVDEVSVPPFRRRRGSSFFRSSSEPLTIGGRSEGGGSLMPGLGSGAVERQELMAGDVVSSQSIERQELLAGELAQEVLIEVELSMPRFQPGETPSPGIVCTEVSLAVSALEADVAEGASGGSAELAQEVLSVVEQEQLVEHSRTDAVVSSQSIERQELLAEELAQECEKAQDNLRAKKDCEMPAVVPVVCAICRSLASRSMVVPIRCYLCRPAGTVAGDAYFDGHTIRRR